MWLDGLDEWVTVALLIEERLKSGDGGVQRLVDDGLRLVVSLEEEVDGWESAVADLDVGGGAGRARFLIPRAGAAVGAGADRRRASGRPVARGTSGGKGLRRGTMGGGFCERLTASR